MQFDFKRKLRPEINVTAYCNCFERGHSTSEEKRYKNQENGVSISLRLKSYLENL